MKQIKLINLKLINFKGIKEFELAANGNDLSVFGANATGKTTLFDAFVWLLFDKDSRNASTSNFNVKTLVDGKPINKIEHSVEAVLEVDGDRKSLKKVYKEKWTKKRGSNVENFSGHTTDYFVNEVPGKKKDYDEAIKELVDENVFKLLTNPTYFNEAFHWKERRDLLFDIAGDITDEDVIGANKDLVKLLDVLNGNSIEDHKKIINAKRRDINKEIERIPIRIDEIYRGLPDITGLDENELKSDIKAKETKIESLKAQINDIKNGSETVKLKKEISDIEMKMNSVKSEHDQEQKQELYKLQTRLSEEETNLTLLRGSVRTQLEYKKLNEQSVQNNKSFIDDKKQQMDELRRNYKELQEQYDLEMTKEFDDSECVCPTCERELEQETIDESIARFNKNKSDSLEKIKQKQNEINEKGIRFKHEVEELTKEIEKLKQDIEPVDKEIEKITEQGKKKETEIELLKEQVKKAESSVVPVEENKNYIELSEQVNELKNKINSIEESTDKNIKGIRVFIVKHEDDKKQLQVDLSKFEQLAQYKERIKELEAEEKALAAEYEELEHQLHLTEEFTRKKVEMLTENINSKFEHARFNLFTENINGGIEETCETTFEGVPYGSDLNNAAKINIGLDIINTLSGHYGVQAPIFVDNAESVTDLIHVDSQLISLIVSAEDKELRIETKSDKESDVA